SGMTLPWHSQVDIIAAISFLGFVLISIPLYWHCVAWNIGCVLYIFWVGGQCLFQAINVLVWRDNVINVAPVWCDIFIRFYIGASIGVCTASLVINRRLYHIANVSSVSITRADKRRNIITDFLIGLGIPVLAIAVYWVYEGHRFDLMEGVGCIEAYPNTWLALILYYLWPIPIGLVSATYCVLTLTAFFKRRRRFTELMASNTNITFNRYFRLMGLASLEFLFTLPLTVYNITENFKLAPYKWRGMANLHSRFGRVDQYPAVIWRADPQLISVINFRLWMPIACALVFFLFFGLAEEARKHYKLAMTSIAKKVGISTMERSSEFDSSVSKTVGLSGTALPTFIDRTIRRASLDSVFSDDQSAGHSAEGSHDKALHSPSGLSVGSSTFIGSPVSEKDQEHAIHPVPPLPSLPFMRVPDSSAVHHPTPLKSSEEEEQEEGDVQAPHNVGSNSIEMV
ncbi:putative fungal pheromoneG-protein-coupled receptor, partial [Dichomitus squalens]